MLVLLLLPATLLLLFILPVRSFSRDAALVFVEVELSLEALLALGSLNVGVGLSFHDSWSMDFISFKVDLARPLKLGALKTALGVLNCAASNLSTGFETRSDFLLDDDASDLAAGRFVVCSPSSVMLG